MRIRDGALLGPRIVRPVEDEIAEGVEDEVAGVICSNGPTQCEWLPRIRSAPAAIMRDASVRCIGSTESVYSMPQCGMTMTMSAPAFFAALMSRMTLVSSPPTRGVRAPPSS